MYHVELTMKDDTRKRLAFSNLGHAINWAGGYNTLHQKLLKGYVMWKD